MQDRFYVANQLRAIGQLLTLKGDNPFKAQAYQRGAQALENLAEDFDRLVRTHGLTGISGIGAALAGVIEEIYQSGESYLLQQLRAELPPGAVELSRLPGLNLKKIAALHDQLAMETVEALKPACQEGLVRNVKGFGMKSEAKLLADIDKLVQPSERFLLHHALDAAELLLAHLRAAPELLAAAVAGALRRCQETVRQLIIVAGTDQPKAIIDHFLCFPSIANTIELTERECLVQLAAGMKTRLVIAEPQDYAATLHRWTGSKAHLERLAQLAPNPTNHVHDAVKSVPTRIPARVEQAETAIYRHLGLPYIAPELRENDGALDYPDSILERFDVIIASIHARNKMDAARMTDRLLKVLQLPLFKIWGHPLGRLIQSRAPIECRVEEILDAIAASRAAIEINGDSHRLDLEPRWIRRARERGIKFIVSTDAHSTRGMGNLQFGVAMARRGWLQRSDVLNTSDAATFAEAVRP